MHTTFVPTSPGAFSLWPSFPLRRLQIRSIPRTSTCSRHQVLNLSIKPSDNHSTVTQSPSIHGRDFTEWGESQGIQTSSIVLTESYSPSHLSVSTRGLCATAPIQKGASLTTVPAKSALQVTSTADESIPEQFPIPKSEWRKLPWFARLALLLISARKNKNHPLHPWTKLLPSSVDLPYHWSDSEISQLQDQRIASLIKTQRHSYQNCFQKICNALPQKNSLSYKEFSWAVDCVRSRSFSGPLEAAPFRDRLRLIMFVAVNTFVWPSLHVLPWENAVNGMIAKFGNLLTYWFDVKTKLIFLFLHLLSMHYSEYLHRWTNGYILTFRI